MGLMNYQGSAAPVRYDPARGEFVGRTAALADDVTFRGRSVMAVRSAFRHSRVIYLSRCARTGKKGPTRRRSGRMSVRISPEAHEHAGRAAIEAGQDFGVWLEDTLRQATASLQGRPVLAEEMGKHFAQIA